MAYYPPLPPGQAAMVASAPVVIASNQTAIPVTGTFWQATQPVSVASLPLPTGAATEATLSAINTKTLAAGQALMAASSPVVIASNQSAVPVSGTFWQATQPISAASLPLPSGASTEATLAALSAKFSALGQNTMAASVPVVIASNQSAVPVSGTFWQATQPVSLATLPALVAGGAIIGKVGIDQTTPGTTNAVSLSHVGATAVATGNGVVGAGVQRVAVASDNTPFGIKVSDGTNTAAVKAASTAAAATDPALVVALSPNNEVGVIELPAAAASADGLANPTVSQIGAAGLMFNGATWDRQRNNVDTTTGDTGAKTATFGGNTQTNYNARGAYITVIVSAVSGTTPTLTAQLQMSPNGGTTWYNVGPASAALSVAGSILIAVYPTNFSQTAGATPANLAIGALVSHFINAPLPRTWRIVYTIAGTTPSFTITGTYVNYIL